MDLQCFNPSNASDGSYNASRIAGINRWPAEKPHLGHFQVEIGSQTLIANLLILYRFATQMCLIRMTEVESLDIN